MVAAHAAAPPKGIASGRIGAMGLARLASLELTVAVFALLAAGAIASRSLDGGADWFMAAPLLLGAVNIGAAILVNPTFRRQPALLVFHLALLAVAMLAAAGRLTHLNGRIELAQGEAFAGELAWREQGPLHRLRLDRSEFINDGFTIRYEKGVRRAETRNTVRWRDDTGGFASEVIGDNQPLVRNGYRFYTSANKGFAPIFVWHPAGGGAPQRGAVHLPSYPAHELRQAIEWNVPGTRVRLWTMLQFDEVLLDPERVSHFRLPERHALVIRAGAQRHELQPGGNLSLTEGTLVYERLSTWMGYTVFYDWTLPWLLAACLVAVGSLAVHFWRRFTALPWDR